MLREDFQLDKKPFPQEDKQALEQVVQVGGALSILGRFQDLYGQNHLV